MLARSYSPDLVLATSFEPEAHCRHVTRENRLNTGQAFRTLGDIKQICWERAILCRQIPYLGAYGGTNIMPF